MTATKGDTLQAAARRALAGGRWHSADDAADRLAADVPERNALDCYLRLAAAGWKPTGVRAERVRIGRGRLVREALQHLVQRGDAEADGRGDARRYRIIAGGTTVGANDRPKPRREWVSLERLIFDPLLQQRVELYDEATVKKYLLAMEDGDEFPPLDVVGDDSKRWVIDGFNRGEAYRRKGVGSVECVVYQGAYPDAQYWSLRSNAHNPLTRTDADCRKAFASLIGSKELMRRVYEVAAVKGGGGLERAICAATGLSKGAVYKYLRNQKLKVEKGKLVADPTADPDPEDDPPFRQPDPPARAGGVQGEIDWGGGGERKSGSARAGERGRDEDDDEDDEEETPDFETEGEKAIGWAKDQVAAVQKELRGIGKRVASLLKGPAAAALRKAAAGRGVAFEVKADEVQTMPLPDERGDRADPDAAKVVVKKTEWWPALADVAAVFADVSAQLYAGR